MQHAGYVAWDTRQLLVGIPMAHGRCGLVRPHLTTPTQTEDAEQQNVRQGGYAANIGATRPSVTFLVVAENRDAILVAGDGRAIYVDRTARPGHAEVDAVRMRKFSQVGNLPLLVGTIGNPLSLPAMKQLLLSNPAKWGDFVEQASELVTKVNNRLRETAQRVGSVPVTTDRVLVGYIDSEPGVVQIENSGEPAYHEISGHGIWFFGLYCTTMRVTYSVVKEYPPDFNPGELNRSEDFSPRCISFCRRSTSRLTCGNWP
jgi:hypothetical protein